MTGLLQRRRSAALVAAGLAAATALSACSSSSNNKTTSTSGGGSKRDRSRSELLIPTSGPLSSASTVYGLVAKALGTPQIPGTDTIDGRKVQIILRDNQGTGPGHRGRARGS